MQRYRRTPSRLLDPRRALDSSHRLLLRPSPVLLPPPDILHPFCRILRPSSCPSTPLLPSLFSCVTLPHPVPPPPTPGTHLVYLQRYRPRILSVSGAANLSRIWAAPGASGSCSRQVSVSSSALSSKAGRCVAPSSPVTVTSLISSSAELQTIVLHCDFTCGAAGVRWSARELLQGARGEAAEEGPRIQCVICLLVH